MRDIDDIDEFELDKARAWSPSSEMVAGMVTGALSLLAVGVLFGAYAVAANF
jgi:hypothetical protein